MRKGKRMPQKVWTVWEAANEDQRRSLLRTTATRDARDYVCFLREELSHLSPNLCQEVAIFLSSMHYELESQLLQLETSGQEDSLAYNQLLDFYRESGFLTGLEGMDAEA